jgi:4-carboxymuconolactone decarboxylase
MPALEYPDTATLPEDLRRALATHQANVYRMVAHSKGMAVSFLSMADAMLQTNSMPMPMRELAILRVGHAYGSRYELHHHERFARAVGLGDTAIEAAGTGDTRGLSEQEAVIIRWTDRLLAEHTLDGADRDQAVETLSVTGFADFVLTVGFYQLVCNYLNAFEVDTAGEA